MKEHIIDKVANALKQFGGESLYSRELAELIDIPEEKVGKCLNNLFVQKRNTAYGIDKIKAGNANKYFYVGETTVEAPEKEDDCKKNAEGYSDPTVARALNSKGKHTDKLQPGGVYLFSLGTVSKEVLILDDRSPDTVVCLDVESIDCDRQDSDTIVSCKLGNFTNSVHVNWLKSYDPLKIDHTVLWSWPMESYKKIVTLSPLRTKAIEVPVRNEEELKEAYQKGWNECEAKMTITADKIVTGTSQAEEDFEKKLAIRERDIYKDFCNSFIEILMKNG